MKTKANTHDNRFMFALYRGCIKSSCGDNALALGINLRCAYANGYWLFTGGITEPIEKNMVSLLLSNHLSNLKRPEPLTNPVWK